jgi:ketosteroid isomerase-like protein
MKLNPANFERSDMKKLMTLFAIMALFAVSAMAQRAPAVPAATGPMLDMANKIADAINNKDAAALTKMLASDCVYLDEDGHAPPPAGWVTKLTTGEGKKIAISNTHGQMFGDTGWVSFNFDLTETFQGQPKTLKGIASLVVKKAPSGDWQIQLIHGAFAVKVAGLTGE